MLPILQKQPLLAFPEDARHRDRYGIIFSLEVLLAIEKAEPTLKTVFHRHSQESSARQRNAAPTSGHHSSKRQQHGNARDEFEFDSIINALHRINLLPNVITEQQVRQLVSDVLPAVAMSASRAVREGTASKRTPATGVKGRNQLLFPQWEWILCVVAYEAVDSAVRGSRERINPEVNSFK